MWRRTGGRAGGALRGRPCSYLTRSTNSEACGFSGGPTPHTWALTVMLRDRGPQLTPQQKKATTGGNSNRSRPIWPSGNELCLQFNRGTCHYGARCQYEHLWQQRSRGLSPSGHAAREFWISQCRPLLVDHPLCPVTAVLTNFRALGPAAPGPAQAVPMTGPAFNRKLKALNLSHWLVCLACQAIACVEVVPRGPYHREFLEN